ncbi:hypothetical protein DFH08DRAFT_824764 [Mycena albidolilacea]|uniref:Uncharacterized protein n=1 Tax=Mycena albidolilacea TaxID=1033008 RepID=A0AAD6Z442_9AGAR|nr:hypothetical protein DFH08DRAFT_824764 [Mycena albidolilacea]
MHWYAVTFKLVLVHIMGWGCSLHLVWSCWKQASQYQGRDEMVMAMSEVVIEVRGDHALLVGVLVLLRLKKLSQDSYASNVMRKLQNTGKECKEVQYLHIKHFLRGILWRGTRYKLHRKVDVLKLQAWCPSISAQCGTGAKQGHSLTRRSASAIPSCCIPRPLATVLAYGQLKWVHPGVPPRVWPAYVSPHSSRQKFLPTTNGQQTIEASIGQVSTDRSIALETGSWCREESQLSPRVTVLK